MAEETAIAFTYNGSSHAVVMATPQDREDFAVGFSLTEGMVAGADEIESVETLEFDEGIELRLWIREDRMAQLRQRRRAMAGPTGCGLCGVESLAGAMRPVAALSSEERFACAHVMAALRACPEQRISVEMVQKAAVLGAPVIVAVSAPTALAIRTAEKAGITLAAVARNDGFEVFTHVRRIAFEADSPATLR